MSSEIILWLSGISSILVGMVTWLGKRYVEHRLNVDVLNYQKNADKQLASYKSELDANMARYQTDADRKLENYKAELDYKYKTKLGMLHTKRFEVIAEMFRLIAESHGAVAALVASWGYVGQPSEEERGDKSLPTKIVCGQSIFTYFKP